MWLTNLIRIASLHGYRIVDQIHDRIQDSIRHQLLVKDFQLNELPQLSEKFDKLLKILTADNLLLVWITNILAFS